MIQMSLLALLKQMIYVEPGFLAGNLAEGQTRTAEKRLANARHDGIAAEMWEQYQAELQERGYLNSYFQVPIQFR